MQNTRQLCVLVLAVIPLIDRVAVSVAAEISVDWVQKLGTPDGEGYPEVAADGAGHVYIAATTNGSLAGPRNIYGSNFVAQYSTSGNLNWIRQFGVSSNNTHAVAADAQGNAYVAGETWSSIGIDYFPARDAFVAKYDAAGNQQWYRQIGTTESEIAEDVAVDVQGNIYLSGGVTGSLNGQPHIGAHIGFDFDGFLTKLRDDGTVLWTRLFGGLGNDVAWNVAPDLFGNVYVSGYVETTLPNSQTLEYDAFLSKYDSDGNLKWSRHYGTPQYEQPDSLVIDATGNVIVGGTTFGNLTGSDPSPGAAYIAKFTPDGDVEWLHQFNSGGGPRALAIDPVNNLYVSNLVPGLLISKLDADGNLAWNLPANADTGTTNLRPWSAFLADTGSLYLSGTVTYFPGDTYVGNANLFVLKISEVPEPSVISATVLALLVTFAVRTRGGRLRFFQQ